jgi:hypothetical protein
VEHKTEYSKGTTNLAFHCKCLDTNPVKEEMKDDLKKQGGKHKI